MSCVFERLCSSLQPHYVLLLRIFFAQIPEKFREHGMVQHNVPKGTLYVRMLCMLTALLTGFDRQLDYGKVEDSKKALLFIPYLFIATNHNSGFVFYYCSTVVSLLFHKKPAVTRFFLYRFIDFCSPFRHT